MLLKLLLLLKLLMDQLKACLDVHERVVDLVSHTRSEGTNRGEALIMSHRSLRYTLIGDVSPDNEHL